MNVLWMNLAFVFTLALSARYFAREPLSQTASVTWSRPNKFLALLATFSLVLVAGLRSNIGDTFFYKHIYETNNFTWDYIFSQKDIGFGIYQRILKSFSDDPQLLIFVTALVTNALIVVVLYRYSKMFELSLFVYITGGMFLISMNGMRQCLAAAIIFLGTRFLIDGKFIKYALVIIIASYFHESALILLPIYFLVRTKPWSKATFVLLGFSVLIVIAFDQFSAVLFSSIQDTQYGHYQTFQEGGASKIRIAVNGIPLLIAYLGRHRLKEVFPKSDYFVNMSIVGFVFMVISSKNWIFARFSIYFNLYQIVLISWIIVLFRKKDQKLFYYGILICYLVYYYFESVISLNIVYLSDYF
ncbi:hypothetical protein A374_03144 [Fictibacillus macauensis ZFHKF-1]|uniref:Capsular polysaccharide biosynthesis protein n=1 Tax=Fictibacillus macauensis ZFHKF-1 TaxID=1196324 RepID=I8UI90_9BACL|nr:EpsG family protein [Fictibacillus macauensis]EIT86533.1 hypothetical protein A374_03144 [Fictibacillus macauensis ZFHKF-1]